MRSTSWSGFLHPGDGKCRGFGTSDRGTTELERLIDWFTAFQCQRGGAMPTPVLIVPTITFQGAAGSYALTFTCGGLSQTSNQQYWTGVDYLNGAAILEQPDQETIFFKAQHSLFCRLCRVPQLGGNGYNDSLYFRELTWPDGEVQNVGGTC